LVIFEKPTPRMPANAAKSRASSRHGTAPRASDASGAIARSAPSIAPRRSSTAAISAAAMRAPSRLARRRSASANDAGGSASPASIR
jgi:hypothetical protein